MKRLDATLQYYGIEYNQIVSLQILLHKVEYTNKVQKKEPFDVETLNYHKDLVNIPKLEDIFNAVPCAFYKRLVEFC